MVIVHQCALYGIEQSKDKRLITSADLTSDSLSKSEYAAE